MSNIIIREYLYLHCGFSAPLGILFNSDFTDFRRRKYCCAWSKLQVVRHNGERFGKRFGPATSDRIQRFSGVQGECDRWCARLFQRPYSTDEAFGALCRFISGYTYQRGRPSGRQPDEKRRLTARVRRLDIGTGDESPRMREKTKSQFCPTGTLRLRCYGYVCIIQNIRLFRDRNRKPRTGTDKSRLGT